MRKRFLFVIYAVWEMGRLASFAGDDRAYRLTLEPSPSPTIPRPDAPSTLVPTQRAKPVLSDLSRYYIAVEGFTSRLEAEMIILKGGSDPITSWYPKAGSKASTAEAANLVRRYVALLRPIAAQNSGKLILRDAIAKAETILLDYERLLDGE